MVAMDGIKAPPVNLPAFPGGRFCLKCALFWIAVIAIIVIVQEKLK